MAPNMVNNQRTAEARTMPTDGTAMASEPETKAPRICEFCIEYLPAGHKKATRWLHDFVFAVRCVRTRSRCRLMTSRWYKTFGRQWEIQLLISDYLDRIQYLIPDSDFMKQIMDAEFETLDIDPKDGFITLHEGIKAFGKYDTNGDGCISEQEFEHVNHLPIPHLIAIFYHHFDKDSPDCVSVNEISKRWHIIDTSGDGKADLKEFETSAIRVATSVLNGLFPIGGITG